MTDLGKRFHAHTIKNRGLRTFLAKKIQKGANLTVSITPSRFAFARAIIEGLGVITGAIRTSCEGAWARPTQLALAGYACVKTLHLFWKSQRIRALNALIHFLQWSGFGRAG